MQPAPSLAEVPPKTNETRHGPGAPANNQQPLPPPPSQEHHVSNQQGPVEPGSPPVRQDTFSSASTLSNAATLVSSTSIDTASSAYSLESPTYAAAQAVFSVKDGADVAANRRASRRRTGPLSSLQRERAALIRKLGACIDCRRRRVACHPNHHNMTWEDAARKYRSNSPTLLEFVQVAGRPISPAPLSAKTVYDDGQEMDIDSPTPQQPGRPPLSDARTRTPLPSAPRLDKPALIAPLPAIDNLRSDLENTAARILSTPHRNRYTSARAILLHWQDEEDRGVRHAVEELANVFESSYNFTSEFKPIPLNSEDNKSSRWLSREIFDFVDHRDQRDVLKIVYYTGHTYLDGDREMVLASSKDPRAATASVIRWSGIQQILEDASSDTLLIMDAAYYPSSNLVRRQGVLELIAASTSEDHVSFLDRSAFTRTMTHILRLRASQTFTSPLTAAELHAKLLSHYPKMIRDRHPEREVLTSFPSPLHVQLSGNAHLPSILLAPLPRGFLPPLEPGPPSPLGGSHLSLTFRLNDENIDTQAWEEWLRIMPEGIRGVKFDGPYRNPLR